MALVLVVYEDREIVLETSDGEVCIHWMPEARRVGAKLAISAPKNVNIFRRRRKDFRRERSVD